MSDNEIPATHKAVVADMPIAMAKRPRDHRGYPVPWFTPFHDGQWDFRFVEPGKAEQAIRENRCWTCGGPLVLPCAFVIGPMCAVNRISAEPPSHIACAMYAAKACPFLARPKMTRPSAKVDVPRDTVPGIMIDRNPGVVAVWITDRPTYMTDVRLFSIGDPVRPPRFFARSRPATRQEIMESIEGGLPILRQHAEADGPEAVAELERCVEAALDLLPA